MRNPCSIVSLLLLVALASLPGCAATPTTEAPAEAPPPPAQAAPPSPAARSRAAARPDMPPRPALINHFVTFKLYNPGDIDELLADCDHYLARIPGVVSYFAGTHHDIGRGDRVFTDYHVGFFVGFNSDEDYRAYVDHPDHIMVVRKWQPRLDRLRVYDVWDDGERD